MSERFDEYKRHATTRIIRNAGRCIRCNVVIESRSRHEFVSCPGNHIAVDGGFDYLKRSGNWLDFEELSEFEDVEVEPKLIDVPSATIRDVAEAAHEAERTAGFSSRFIGNVHRTEADAVMFLAGLPDGEFERAVKTGKVEMLNRFFGLAPQRLTRRVRTYKYDLKFARNDAVVPSSRREAR